MIDTVEEVVSEGVDEGAAEAFRRGRRGDGDNGDVDGDIGEGGRRS